MAENVVSSNNLGDDFDVGIVEPNKIHLKLDGSLERKVDGSVGVVGTPSLFYLCHIWAEENGNLNTNHAEWSFGNGQSNGTGATGNWGVVLPFSGDIIALSLGLRVGGTGVTTVAVQLNSVDQDTISMSGSKGWKTGIVLPFGAGDVLNFRTRAAGGANDGVISAIVRYVI